MTPQHTLETLATLEGDLGLTTLPVEALQAFCRYLRLPESGGKAAVVARLRRAVREARTIH